MKTTGWNMTTMRTRTRTRTRTRKGRVSAAVGRDAVSRFCFFDARCVGYVLLEEEGGAGLSDGCGAWGGRRGGSLRINDGFAWVWRHWSLLLSLMTRRRMSF